MKYYNYFSRNL